MTAAPIFNGISFSAQHFTFGRSGTESPRCRLHLQIPVVILAEELQEAKDGLHDDDDETHLPVVLVLVPRAGLAVRRVEVLFRVGVTPVGVEGLLCGG